MKGTEERGGGAMKGRGWAARIRDVVLGTPGNGGRSDASSGQPGAGETARGTVVAGVQDGAGGDAPSAGAWEREIGPAAVRAYVMARAEAAVEPLRGGIAEDSGARVPAGVAVPPGLAREVDAFLAGALERAAQDAEAGRGTKAGYGGGVSHAEEAHALGRRTAVYAEELAARAAWGSGHPEPRETGAAVGAAVEDWLRGVELEYETEMRARRGDPGGRARMDARAAFAAGSAAVAGAPGVRRTWEGSEEAYTAEGEGGARVSGLVGYAEYASGIEEEEAEALSAAGAGVGERLERAYGRVVDRWAWEAFYTRVEDMTAAIRPEGAGHTVGFTPADVLQRQVYADVTRLVAATAARLPRADGTARPTREALWATARGGVERYVGEAAWAAARRLRTAPPERLRGARVERTTGRERVEADTVSPQGGARPSRDGTGGGGEGRDTGPGRGGRAGRGRGLGA